MFLPSIAVLVLFISYIVSPLCCSNWPYVGGRASCGCCGFEVGVGERGGPLFLCAFVAIFNKLVIKLGVTNVSKTIPFLRRRFVLSSVTLKLIMDVLAMNYLYNTLLKKNFDSHCNERGIVFSSTIFFVISSLNYTLSNGLISLLIFHLVYKLNVKIVSTMTPVCVSRVSPTQLEKALISCGRLTVIVKVLVTCVMSCVLLSCRQG